MINDSWSYTYRRNAELYSAIYPFRLQGDVFVDNQTTAQPTVTSPLLPKIWLLRDIWFTIEELQCCHCFLPLSAGMSSWLRHHTWIYLIFHHITVLFQMLVTIWPISTFEGQDSRRFNLWTLLSTVNESVSCSVLMLHRHLLLFPHKNI